MNKAVLSLLVAFSFPFLASVVLCGGNTTQQRQIPAAQGRSTQAHNADAPTERFGILRGKALNGKLDQSQAARIRSRRIEMSVLPGIQRLVPQEYPTIQEGIDASTHGDTVLVSEGTYFENIKYWGKSIVVASLYLLDRDTSHISRTVIDGSQAAGTGSVVCFASGEDTNSVLCGFTIRGGSGTYVPAWDQQTGGGVLLWESSGRLVRNIITGNRVSAPDAWGGGVSMTGLTNTGQTLIMEDNIVERNIATATTGLGFGGGVAIYQSQFRLTGNVFEYDSTRGPVQSGASGVMIFFSSGNVGIVSGNVFRNNTVLGDSSSYACLVVAQYEGEVIIDGNVFEDNSVMSTTLSAYGGALYLDNLSAVTPEKHITRNVIRGNVQTSSLRYAYGAAMIVWDSHATVAGNLIEDNISQAGISAFGGGIYGIYWGGLIGNNIITGNTSTYGGGIGIAGSPPGIPQAIVNNTVSGNVADFGGGLYVGGANTISILLNNILWDDSSSAGEIYSLGTVEAHYSNIEGGWSGGTGNINLDPMFADTLYRLADTSPCIGMGGDSVEIGGIWYHSVASDFASDPRPVPIGSPPDMGAWENPLAIPTSVAGGRPDLPAVFELSQNYPNPFNPVTRIGFRIPSSALTTLKVYDVIGREVATLMNGEMTPGSYEVAFDATGLASGVYFYKLTSGLFIETKKLVVMR